MTTTKRDLRRVNVELSIRAAGALDRTQVLNDSTTTEAIRRALLITDWLERERAEGRKVYSSKPDGTERREIVFL